MYISKNELKSMQSEEQEVQSRSVYENTRRDEPSSDNAIRKFKRVGVGTLPPESERSCCIALHLLGLSGLIFSITCVHIIAPLILWLLKRSSSPLVDRTGKEVLNFQISWTLYLFASASLCFVLIGWFIFPFVTLTWLILIIRAAMKASKGEFYLYPMTIQFFNGVEKG